LYRNYYLRHLYRNLCLSFWLRHEAHIINEAYRNWQ
jgi:hypothetical protein